ncbi:hypothetical protein LXA43DRAFT_1082553 [Ganoderma leucocontextum]|nr:hypothetical protein LXA43DRAFT_1082553 [Ganoderma leucocontextum]
MKNLCSFQLPPITTACYIMPPKPHNFMRPPVIHHDTGSPDPLDVIGRPSTQSPSDSAAGVDSDPSPPDRAPKGKRVLRRLPHHGQSNEEWSPPTSRLVNRGQTLAQSPEHDEEEDFSGALPAHETSVADAGVGKKLDFEVVSSESDTEDALDAMPSTNIPDVPRPVSPDVTALFGQLDEDLSSLPHSRPVSAPEPETQPEEYLSEDDDTPLIPPLPSPAPPRVWHSADGVGTVLVPVRDNSKFAADLQDAERTMASQIASALSNPCDEGLGSATFQTLLDTFLLPRLKGRNSKGERVRIHQYSQFAARRGQQQSATAREHAKKDLDALARMYKLDDEDAANLDAVAQRRVPDMTSMAIFEEEVYMQDGLSYRLASHRGPKLCITEIKSFNWSGDHGLLDHVLSVTVAKAHKQNYAAARFLFMEDERLDRVASFVGVGPVWLYGEWYRTHYPDLHGMPLPRNPTEVKRYKEREAVETPKKTAEPGPSRKRPRVYSPESDAPEQPDVADADPAALPVRGGPNTRGVVRSGQSEVYLPQLGSIPWTVPEHIQEIFSRRRRGEIVRPRPSGPLPLPYLYVLDPDGRTYEAFDAITERIRGWYTDELCHPEYKIIFDEDPYADGSCPGMCLRVSSSGAC